MSYQELADAITQAAKDEGFNVTSLYLDEVVRLVSEAEEVAVKLQELCDRLPVD